MARISRVVQVGCDLPKHQVYLLLSCSDFQRDLGGPAPHLSLSFQGHALIWAWGVMKPRKGLVGREHLVEEKWMPPLGRLLFLLTCLIAGAVQQASRPLLEKGFYP